MEQENTNKGYEYTKEDIVEKPKTASVVVVAIRKTTGFDIFGNKAEDPKKEYLQLLVENSDLGIKDNVNMSFFDNG